MDKATIKFKLGFAERRLQELLQELAGKQDRLHMERLMQEFFFHLIGATELLAQLVNERYTLGLDPEDVNIPTVVQRRIAVNHGADQTDTVLGSLYQNPKRWRIVAGDYSDATYIVRLINYRNQVSHRYLNPLQIDDASGEVRLCLDPRHALEDGFSARKASDELQYMYRLVYDRCNSVLGWLPGD